MGRSHNLTIMNIEIVKGKPYRQFFAWWGKEVLNTNYYFKRNEDLHFIHTLRYDTGRDFDDKRKRREMADYLWQLRRNGFRYFCHHAIRKDIYEFIDFIKKNRFTIAQMWDNVITYYDDLGMYEFHGNLVEYSAAFQYQIYDESLVNEIKDLIKNIPVSIR